LGPLSSPWHCLRMPRATTGSPWPFTRTSSGPSWADSPEKGLRCLSRRLRAGPSRRRGTSIYPPGTRESKPAPTEPGAEVTSPTFSAPAGVDLPGAGLLAFSPVASQDGSSTNFGLFITYVLPGFTALQGVPFLAASPAGWGTATAHGNPNLTVFLSGTF